ncbi:MAG: replicative DNA helicase [Deltaproteobacteria bacterium]|nr:replicative DNA helicase [Deltaproteobacteria bacterium]
MTAPRIAGRTPPQDIEAERAVLGSILLSNEAVYSAMEILRTEDFYRPAHALIYRAMLDLTSRGEPVDLVTLQAQLQATQQLEAVGGAGPIIELATAVPTAANVRHYAEIVRRVSTRRRLIDAATGIVGLAFENGNADEVLDTAERAIFEVSQDRAKKSLVPVSEIVKETFQRVIKLFDEKKAITGVTTGFTKLDSITSGLQPSDLVIVAGRPSMGKTAFALNLATSAALKDKRPVAVFSLEMSKEQLVTRMLCSEGRIDSFKLRGGFLSESDWPKLAKAAGTISEAPIYIDDTAAASVLEVRAKCRRLAAENDLGLVVVDYLQLMRGTGNTQGREQEISEISRGLKSLAKELNIPVIALSQLNRSLEQRTDKRPMLSDLRESGAIEQDADVIMFVYRDEVYKPDTQDKGVAEIIIGKQRNGPIGIVRLKFFLEHTRFENLAED